MNRRKKFITFEKFLVKDEMIWCQRKAKMSGS